jgi:hypothetical protein
MSLAMLWLPIAARAQAFPETVSELTDASSAPPTWPAPEGDRPMGGLDPSLHAEADTGWLVAGSVLFGVFYALPIVAASVGVASRDPAAASASCIPGEAAVGFPVIPVAGLFAEAAAYSHCEVGGLLGAGGAAAGLQLAGLAMIVFAVAFPTMRVVRYEAGSPRIEMRAGGLALVF